MPRRRRVSCGILIFVSYLCICIFFFFFFFYFAVHCFHFHFHCIAEHVRRVRQLVTVFIRPKLDSYYGSWNWGFSLRFVAV